MWGFVLIVNILVFIYGAYYLGIGINGFRKEKKLKEFEPTKKFALIISAHNEKNVIRTTLQSLKKLNYPKDLYDIYLIADNCTDNTAEIGREEGVKVYERFNDKLRGKGYAIEWILTQFDYTKYDAISIFDADNIIHNDFLYNMNIQLCNGREVIQGYIESKNPNDNWITYSYSLSFWSANKIFQKARDIIGLSAQIGGTGFCISTSILKEIGWNANCLTEDLEFSSKLILSGKKVHWCDKAMVYDEKPLELKASWKQRVRWMQGFADVCSRYFFKLMKKAIKDRDMVAFDSAIYTLQPYMTIFLGIVTVLDFIYIPFNFNAITWSVISIVQFMVTPIIIIADKKINKKMFSILFLYSTNFLIFQLIFGNINKIPYIEVILFYIVFFVILSVIGLLIGGKSIVLEVIRFLLFSIYMLTWIPICIIGIINKNKKIWSHTVHTRDISLDDI